MVAACWNPGDELAFVIEAGGAPVVEQFLRYNGAGNGLHLFQLFWRVKRRDGDTTSESGAELKTDNFGLPVSYELFSGLDVVQKLTFSANEVSVVRRDGSRVQLPVPKRIELVLQAADVLHLAILLPMLRRAVRFQGLNLSPGTLGRSTVLMRRDGRRWIADGAFTLGCDAAGQLQSFTSKDGNATGHRENRSFPDVDWKGLRASKVKPYRAPRTILVREITVRGKVALGATLTLPRRGRPPYPAVLFLQGSGRHDRHGISPLLDTGVHEIVDGLAARGIAGLRFDSRGAGSSRFGDAFESGVDARLADARVALRTLAECPEVDTANLFAMGHSLGAMIALQLATSERLRGVVLLAPPGRRIDQIIAEQVERSLQRRGMAPAQVKLRTRRLARSLARIHGADAGERGEWGLTKLAMADMMRLEPLDLIVKIRRPLLICQGAADIQISVERDAVPLFLRAAERNRSAELVLLADADHMFRHESETSSPEHYFVRRPLAGGLLDSLQCWIRRHIPER